MKALAVTLALLTAAPALADGDVPRAIHAGEASPIDGVLLSVPLSDSYAARLRACASEDAQLADVLAQKMAAPTTQLVIVGSGALVVGVIVGVVLHAKFAPK